jgi:hypothetical protein
MSVADLVSSGYGGYAGWGDAEADADFRATGGAGKKTVQSSSNSNSTVNANAINTENARILKESSTAAIDTLKSGQVPLEQRYQDLIGNIRTTGEQEVKRADVTSAQELARRGVSTQSTYAGEYQQEKRVPVQTAFQSQEAAAQLSAQQAVENRNSAIASIQSATGLNQVNAAMSAYQMAEQARQFDETQAYNQAQSQIQQQQFNQTLNQVQTSIQTVGGRVKLINSQTGEVIKDLGSSTSGTSTTTNPLSYLTGGQSTATGQSTVGSVPRSFIAD